ncbi:MAG: hypothetical protein V1932_00165 [Chloroflexota bacterium]
MSQILSSLRVVITLVLVTLVLSACSQPTPPSDNTSEPEAPSQETTSGLMLKLTLDDLVGGASYIVVGKITQMSSQWNADRTRIYTSVTLSIEEQIKGDWNKNEITITVPGGKVGETAELVEDTAGFSVNERVLVFLTKEDNTFSVFGGFQGKFVVGDNGQIIGKDLSLADLVAQIRQKMGQTP